MHWFILFFLLFLVRPVMAATPADICEKVALQVSAESGVPADVLGALTLTETGRRHEGVLRPWAWAVNAEGAGVWFDDATQAMAFAQARLAAGRANVDIGCFQINYRWHGENFSSLSQMFDPLSNGRYAAGFLRDLYMEMGDWRLAAGAFHSRRPEDARRYLARFDVLRSNLQRNGFSGMTGGPGNYNDFNDADLSGFTTFAGMEIPGLAGPRRERVMLLGAAIGSQPDPRTGSLAVMGQTRGPLIDHGNRGALVMLTPMNGGGGAPSLWQ